MRILDPYSVLAIDLSVDWESLAAGTGSYIQALEGNSDTLLAQAEVLPIDSLRPMVIEPMLVDLRRCPIDEFSVNLYVRELDPPTSLVCVSDEPALALRCTQVGTRRWLLTGSLIQTPTKRKSLIRVLGKQDLQLGAMTVLLPSLRVGDVRVAWHGRVASPDSFRFWLLMEPFCGSVGDIAPFRHEDEVRITATEPSSGGGLWMELEVSRRVCEPVSIRIAGEVCTFLAPNPWVQVR